MSEDEFDLERLRLRPEDIRAHAGKAGARAPHARRQDGFIMMPMSWANALARARNIHTHKLASHLLHQHFKNGGQIISLTNVSLANTGVTRRSKWRALDELEQLKLIEVDRRRRKSPRVTLLKTRPNRGR